jgi:hypothetical protein
MFTKCYNDFYKEKIEIINIDDFFSSNGTNHNKTIAKSTS